jgi:hypothetical protein
MTDKQILLIRHKKTFYVFKLPRVSWSETNDVDVTTALVNTDDLDHAIAKIDEVNTEGLPVGTNRLQDGSEITLIEVKK